MVPELFYKTVTESLYSRGEHGQHQDWISCRILAIFSDQDWIWIFIFEKNWIRTGSGYWLDFYNEIFLRVIQDVTNDGGSVFFAMVTVQNRPAHNRPLKTDHSKQTTFITDPFITDPSITDHVHNRPVHNRSRS